MIAVFDLDGTLVDSFDQINRAANIVRERMSLEELDPALGKLQIGLDACLLFPELESKSAPQVRAVKEFREILEKLINSEGVSLFSGAELFLSKMSDAGFVLCVASNKPQKLVDAVVSRSQLAHHISVSLGTGKFAAKPNPEMLQECLDRLGTTELLMFGDRPEDIYASHACGGKSVGIGLGGFDEYQLMKAGANIFCGSWKEATQHVVKFRELVSRP